MAKPAITIDKQIETFLKLSKASADIINKFTNMSDKSPVLNKFNEIAASVISSSSSSATPASAPAPTDAPAAPAADAAKPADAPAPTDATAPTAADAPAATEPADAADASTSSSSSDSDTELDNFGTDTTTTTATAPSTADAPKTNAETVDASEYKGMSENVQKTVSTMKNGDFKRIDATNSIAVKTFDGKIIYVLSKGKKDNMLAIKKYTQDKDPAPVADTAPSIFTNGFISSGKLKDEISSGKKYELNSLITTVILAPPKPELSPVTTDTITP